MYTGLESLLVSHDYISREIGIAEMEMAEGEFKEGHVNGLKEARNRVEQAMTELFNSTDDPLTTSNRFDVDEKLKERAKFSRTLSTHGYADVLVLGRERVPELAEGERLEILKLLEDGPISTQELADQLESDEDNVEEQVKNLNSLSLTTIDDDDRVKLNHRYAVIEPLYVR